jgi:hypothetical protein
LLKQRIARAFSTPSTARVKLARGPANRYIDDLTQSTPSARDTVAISPDAAAKLQKAYVAKRRAWAKTVGRPYERDKDPRPPPGELDAGPEE